MTVTSERHVNRRTLLRGVAIGSIVPATAAGTAVGSTRRQETPADAQTADDAGADAGDGAGATVEIVDVPETVVGGALLQWTVELTNDTDETITTTVEYTVDGEPAGAVTVTLEPGESEQPFASGRRTEPVATEETLELRAETETDADTATVTVLPAEEIDPELTFPDPQLTVEPDTTVHFEVGAIDPDPDIFQETAWWVDGEFVGDSLTPWQGEYYAEQNAHYWQETFAEPGTYEVVAGVTVDDEQYRTSWTVTVEAGGLADPVIDAARPAPGVLEVGTDASLDLEIDVTDPDGNLDRVVWWLTQADVILGVSDVAGASDTATLSVDGGLCHTCAIVPWVITGDGTFTSDSVWIIDDPELDAPDVDDDDISFRDDEPAPDDPGVEPDPEPDEPDVKEEPEPKPTRDEKPDPNGKPVRDKKSNQNGKPNRDGNADRSEKPTQNGTSTRSGNETADDCGCHN
ncbi:hypothetical protein C493_01380 [Natronolimnohabitans innermongolicus JCM 12255]|uniref:Uncharacterized protein n=1 Tax=Natronolimnohabitans innermongolicus JCM 12255 TaxID=1227499 RepID=L9XJI7_9EURY|nr:hypothetical protein C493_01380 [Natronolimnohabitans innermongolicus JCM 12255]